MANILRKKAGTRLERSCSTASHDHTPSDDGTPSHDWIRHGPSQPGIERIEAFFRGHAYDPHRHDVYALGCTLSGVQSFDYRGARADSEAGRAIVIYPDERHDGHAGVATGFRYRMLYLEPRLMREALGERANSLPFVRGAVTSHPPLLKALHSALYELDHELDALEMDDVVMRISEALISLDSAVRRPHSPVICQTAVERARQYMDSRWSRPVGSRELEQVSGLDRFSLARHFRAQLGTSPYNYLVMRRLEHARAAILRGSSLVEAAGLGGFADQSHLTRQFKRAFGLTPGRWRALASRLGLPR